MNLFSTVCELFERLFKMGDDSPAQILMKKGRRGAAAHVHADCANNTSSAILGDILDILLNPGKAIDEWETLDWMRWLMAGGRTPDEFSSIGKIGLLQFYS